MNAGEHRAPTHSPLRGPGACHFNGTFTAWHPGAGGAKRSETERERPGGFLVREDACGDR